MKHFFKLLAIVVSSVIGAVGVAIGILYLSGGFEPKAVEPTNISFVEDKILTYGPTDLKITTTTEEVDENTELTITTYPKGIVNAPSKVKIDQRFVVWPVLHSDGENVGGKVKVTASFKGKLVTECYLFIDVEVKSIKVSMSNQVAKWGEVVEFERFTQVFPERALNPNESTSGTPWEGYGKKTIYYYLVDGDNEPLDKRYAEFMVGTELVGSTISSTQIAQAKLDNKSVVVQTKNNDATNPVTFYIKAYVFSTYSDQEKSLELDQEDQLENMIIDENSNPEDVDKYQKGNNITLSNFEIDGMESSLAPTDPDNLKVVEVYLYEETVFVADVKETTTSDIRKDLDISLYTETPGADVSIIDYFIRDNVTLSIDNTSYFSFGPDKDALGRYKATNSGETTDYWTWKLIWNTPDISNYEALGKEFVITVQYGDSESIKFSFKLKVIDRKATSVEFSTGGDDDLLRIKSGDELEISPSWFKVNPDYATFNAVRLYFTDYKNEIRYIPDSAGVYKATMGFEKTEAKQIKMTAVNGSDEIGAGIEYFRSPDFSADSKIDDIDNYVGYVFARVTYTRHADNNKSELPISVHYVETNSIIKLYNTKFYPQALGGFSTYPFLKVNNIEVLTEFDVQVDVHDSVYIAIKSTNNRMSFVNVGEVVVTAQIVYCDKDGAPVTNIYGEHIWTDITTFFNIEIYDEVSELSFFEGNAITDIREGSTGITGTSLSATEVLDAESYILKEDSFYYIYVKSPNTEALDIAVEGVDRTSLTITPFYRSGLGLEPYYAQLQEINKPATVYEWERELVGTEYGYRIKFLLDNCYKIKLEDGTELELIYKVTVKVDNCELVGYFKVLDNIIESATIKYDDNIIDKTQVESPIELYITEDSYISVAKAYQDITNADDTLTILSEDSVFDFDKLNFELLMADGTTTIATMKQSIKNQSSSSADITGLVYFENGKLVVKNVPYLEEGVQLKVSISSEGLTGINSFYQLSNGSFVAAKENANAEFDLVIHGLKVIITKNPDAPESVKGTKLSRIKFDGGNADNPSRLLFEVKNKKDGNISNISIEDILDFVVSGSSTLYAVDGADIVVLDDISKPDSLLVYFYVGNNKVKLKDGLETYTIFVDPIFKTEVVGGKETIEAPNYQEKITDTIVTVLRNDEKLSEYSNFYVEYVMKNDQDEYETVSRYVEFTREGANSFVNVLNIPNDMEAVVTLTIYESLGNSYKVTYEGVDYNYKNGFYDNDDKEFPISNYILPAEIKPGAVIKYKEKADSEEITLSSMVKEYRVEYEGRTYVFNGEKFLDGRYELPLRDYTYTADEPILKYKNSTYDVKTTYSFSYPKTGDTKIYYYDEEEEDFFDGEGNKLDVPDYIVDWESLKVHICLTSLDVVYETGKFIVNYSGGQYLYVEDKNDFFMNTQSLKEILGGYFYWNKTPDSYEKLYYISDNDHFDLNTTYTITKEGTVYTYFEGNFKDGSGNLIEESVLYVEGEGVAYYSGTEDFLPVRTYFVTNYLGKKYTYVEGFFSAEGVELNSVIGEYAWAAPETDLTFNGGTDSLVVTPVARSKEISTTNITLNLKNIYKDMNITLGQKYYEILKLNDGAYSFEFDGETYFYNSDIEKFITSNGVEFTYEITDWKDGIITYVNADDALHTLNVVVNGDDITIKYNGVNYVYSDTFITREDLILDYELIAENNQITSDATIVKYHKKTTELTITNDADGLFIELLEFEDANINGKYYYDITDPLNPKFVKDGTVEFPFYIIPGYEVAEGLEVSYVINRIPVLDDGNGNKSIVYNGLTFDYNPGNQMFTNAGKYVFGLQTDVTNIADGYVTIISETVNGVNDAQLGFLYLFDEGDIKTVTIDGVKFVYEQNFYNESRKYPGSVSVDLVNNLVEINSNETLELKTSEDGTYKYFEYPKGTRYVYKPELVVKAGADFPDPITSVNTEDYKVNDTIDMLLDVNGYYIERVVMDTFVVKYYYKQVFISTDGYNREFEFEIDYSKTSLVNGGKLYYVNATDATHTLDVVTGKLPVAYYIRYNNGSGDKDYYFNPVTKDFVNTDAGSISQYITIEDYSFIDYTVKGKLVASGETYTGIISAEETFESDYYIIDEDKIFWFERDFYDGSSTYDAFVARDGEGNVDKYYKVESINFNNLTYSIPIIPHETFTATIYKKANFDVELKFINVNGDKYILKDTNFVSLKTGELLPYAILSVDLVRGNVVYEGDVTLAITTCIPQTYIEYEGTTYYYFFGLGEDVLLDRNGNKFNFEFAEDAITFEKNKSEFNYIKYENHIVAGEDNGEVINLDGLYTIIVEGVRYRYNGTTFVNAKNGEAFPHTIGAGGIDLEDFVLTYGSGSKTKIYGKYNSFTVNFEDVEGVDYSTNTSAVNHMRYNDATRTVFSYDLNCDKEVWVIVTVNFADGGTTVIRKKVTIVKNLYIGMKEGVTFKVGENPVGMPLTNESNYEGNVYKIDRLGKKDPNTNVVDYIFYDVVNTPTNLFSIGDESASFAKITYRDDSPYLSPINEAITQTMQVRVVYSFYIQTNNSGYYLDYDLYVNLLKN